MHGLNFKKKRLKLSNKIHTPNNATHIPLYTVHTQHNHFFTQH